MKLMDGRSQGLFETLAGSQWWMFACLTTSKHLWLKAALTHLGEIYPDEYPAAGEGLADRWLTAAELHAAAAITAIEAVTERLIQEREHGEQALLEDAEAAAQEAEAKERLCFSPRGMSC